MRFFLVTILTTALALPPFPLSADEVSVLLIEAEITESEIQSEPEDEDTEEKSEEAPEEQTEPNDTDTATPVAKEPDTGATDTGTETVGDNSIEPPGEETDAQKTEEGKEPPTDPLKETGPEAFPVSKNTTAARTTLETDSTDTKETESAGNSPHIIISEIQIAGVTTSDEFIELYNPDSESKSLSGIRLCRQTSGTGISQIKSFSAGDVVPEKGYYLFAHTDGIFAELADTNTKSSALSTDNAVALVRGSSCTDKSAIILDSVAWGGGSAFSDETPRVGNPPAGSAIVLDIDGESWSLTAHPTPTNSRGETIENGTGEEEGSDGNPKPDTPLPPPGTIVLSEIFPNPLDEAEEWVELFNRSDEEIPLAGWILADAVKEYAFPDGTRIGGNGFLIIPRSESGLALNNGDETVTLIMPNNTASDSYEYLKTVEESSWARNADEAFELTDIPTPGEANRFPVVEEPTIAPLPPDGSVRINEVYPNPETKGEADEWIELANASDMDVSLAGFILRDASKNGKYVFGDAIAIGAGSFLVLPRSETKISLNNSAETLRLLWHDDETIITSLSYSRTVEGASYGYYENARYRFSEKVTPGKKNRFGKEPKIEDSDIPKKGYLNVPVVFSAEGNEDDMRYVWNFGDEHKSYKQQTTYRYEKAGTYHGSLTVRGDIEEVVKTFTIRIGKYPKHDLRITALLPNPDGRDTDSEWIRIENREKKSVDLTGWIIASGTTEEKLVNHKILTEDLSIGAGESFMLTRADARFSLPNKYAVIELRRPDGSRADRIAYDRSDGIDEEELLMIAADGSLIWVTPASSSESSTKTLAETAENAPEDPFLRGMTAHPARFSFARFLALGTPFHLTLPDSAARVLGLSDTKIDSANGVEEQDPSFINVLFQKLNSLISTSL